MPTCVLVLGSARSGTSVTAGVLHRLGVVMGWELPSEDGHPRFDWPDPIEMNPRGFYQDAPIEEALYDIWGNDYPEPGTRAPAGRLGRFNELVAMRAARKHPLWGIKSSHMPWVIEEFLAACPDDVRFVVTQRDPEHSARSIKAWFDDESIEGCRHWVTKVNSQIAAVLADERWEHIPRHVVGFTELLDDPATTIGGLAAFVNRPAKQEAVDFVDPALKRVS